MTNIKDVADAASVSTATVSRVLAGKPNVRAELRQRVLAAVDELEYRPSRVARGLRTQRSNSIGLMVADIRNPYFTSVSRAVEDYAHAHDMTVFLCNSDESVEKEAIYLDLLLGERVDGLILAVTMDYSAAVDEKTDGNTPIVLIDRRVEGSNFDTVVINNKEMAYEIVAHLIEHGYRRIAGIFGKASRTLQERAEGYRAALEDHGLEYSSCSDGCTPAHEEGGFKEAKRLLALPEPPDAIFAGSGLLSVGVFRAIRQSGLTMAEDIAFAAFDDDPWTSLVEPPVTVVAQPTYEIGKTAMELLMARIQDRDRAPREVILKAKLIIRESCGKH